MNFRPPFHFGSEEERAQHGRACDKRNALSSLDRIETNMKAIHTRNFYDVFGAEFASIRNALGHLPDLPKKAGCDER